MRSFSLFICIGASLIKIMNSATVQVEKNKNFVVLVNGPDDFKNEPNYAKAVPCQLNRVSLGSSSGINANSSSSKSSIQAGFFLDSEEQEILNFQEYCFLSIILLLLLLLLLLILIFQLKSSEQADFHLALLGWT
jgi:hypothetical protein